MCRNECAARNGRATAPSHSLVSGRAVGGSVCGFGADGRVSAAVAVADAPRSRHGGCCAPRAADPNNGTRSSEPLQHAHAPSKRPRRAPNRFGARNSCARRQSGARLRAPRAARGANDAHRSPIVRHSARNRTRAAESGRVGVSVRLAACPQRSGYVERARRALSLAAGVLVASAQVKLVSTRPGNCWLGEIAERRGRREHPWQLVICARSNRSRKLRLAARRHGNKLAPSSAAAPPSGERASERPLTRPPTIVAQSHGAANKLLGALNSPLPAEQARRCA